MLSTWPNSIKGWSPLNPNDVISLTPEEQLRVENAQLRMRCAQLEQHCTILECALRAGLTAETLSQYQLVPGRGLVRVPADMNGQLAEVP
jgi:hypothetical protein